ncbi:Hypothetical protein NTJ_10312 [Nesidiocoris tenuis]|uniref:Uncharacterized protein n=1 Tax=Nesidiocoris tenuis TaxID=355587 RepID=A0ABN7AZ93_9HEMI|nr:Hypothetical protein NTJ_10312 [Nesidiocoris tenuis]
MKRSKTTAAERGYREEKGQHDAPRLVCLAIECRLLPVRFPRSSGSGLFRSRVPSAARPVRFRGGACAVSVRRENIEDNQARKKEMLAIVNYMRALR